MKRDSLSWDFGEKKTPEASATHVTNLYSPRFCGVERTKAVRNGFESRLARTWRQPLHRYARFLRVVAYIAELGPLHTLRGRQLATNQALLLRHEVRFALKLFRAIRIALGLRRLGKGGERVGHVERRRV